MSPSEGNGRGNKKRPGEFSVSIAGYYNQTPRVGIGFTEENPTEEEGSYEQECRYACSSYTAVQRRWLNFSTNGTRGSLLL